MPAANLRASVLAARDRLKTGREKLRQLHRGGALGVQVSNYLADLIDGIVQDLFRTAVEQIGDGELPSLVALVPHGGYGRRDVAPFSDVDLMLLYAEGAETRVRPLAQRLTQDICDAGLVLGHSLRSPAEACRMALEDATIFTSLAEARALGGSERLFARFLERFRLDARRRCRPLIEAIEAARQEERNRYGETVFLLTPNVKRSYGGLRDIQMVRWMGFARYGEKDLQTLQQMDALDAEDRQQLSLAHEFLLRLRNELHFQAGKAQDVLDRFEQVRLAELCGYRGDEGLMPVEQFMRDYFQHTGNVRYSAAHFVATAKTESGIQNFLHSLASHDVEGDFRVGPRHIGATRRGLEKVGSDLAQVLRLMDLAALYDKRIDHRTWRTIRQAMTQPKDVQLTPAVTSRFLSLLSQPSRLGHLLRQLHELRVLEKIVPGMSHARCLLQFNEYHKYTVDEHSLRAVEAATRFLDDKGPLGLAYRSLKNKRTLHLALLVHDLGKGYVEDHSEVGARLAEQTAERLCLPAGEAEILRLLVHKHLLLSHLAQFRDINDPGVVVDLAVQVGSPEVLRMLYVMTCADLAAVGPDVLNRWKLEIFTQLYHNTLRQLTGDSLAGTSDEEQQQRRKELLARLRAKAGDAWWERQIEALPPSFLTNGPASRILDDLESLRHLDRSDAIASGRYAAEYRAVEYTIGAYEEITPGIFHRLTGVLTSQRMEILSAEINTLADGLVLDRFYVQDRDFEGEPPAERLEDVSRRLVDVLKKPSDAPPKFPRLWGAPASGTQVPRPPAQVRIDNNTAERFTIVDIFATDRMGLLYTIARLLYEFGLSVHMAKIGTHLDQVVDVFYVTDPGGEKIRDEERLHAIRTRLLERIVQFEEQGLSG